MRKPILNSQFSPSSTDHEDHEDKRYVKIREIRGTNLHKPFSFYL